MERLHDPMFIYFVAFAVFAVLAVRYGRKPILGWLDGEIAKVRSELEEAQKLRAEAEALLADTRSKQAAAMTEAESIVRYAKDEAARLGAQAAENLKAHLAKQEQMAAERIRLAEAEALADVRAAAVDLAMQMAKKTLETSIDDSAAARLVDQALGEIPAASGAKAKAA